MQAPPEVTRARARARCAARLTQHTATNCDGPVMGVLVRPLKVVPSGQDSAVPLPNGLPHVPATTVAVQLS